MTSIQFGQITPFKGPFADQVAENYANKLLQRGFTVRLETSNLQDTLEATVYSDKDASSDTPIPNSRAEETKALKSVIKEIIQRMMLGYKEGSTFNSPATIASQPINNLATRLINIFKKEEEITANTALLVSELKDELKEELENSLFKEANS